MHHQYILLLAVCLPTVLFCIYLISVTHLHLDHITLIWPILYKYTNSISWVVGYTSAGYLCHHIAAMLSIIFKRHSYGVSNDLASKLCLGLIMY